MKLRNLLWVAAAIIILSSIIANFISKNSPFYLPLLSFGIGLAFVVVIVMVISLIKNKGYIK